MEDRFGPQRRSSDLSACPESGRSNLSQLALHILAFRWLLARPYLHLLNNGPPAEGAGCSSGKTACATESAAVTGVTSAWRPPRHQGQSLAWPNFCATL